ncbi:MAG TPA: hypothetical protein VL860_02305 [Planctomycetota bacterium]|nr:hypothetical protein [Planctomycetota bacterium]
MGREDVIRRIREAETAVGAKKQQAQAKAEQLLRETDDKRRDLVARLRAEAQTKLERLRTQYQAEITQIHHAAMEKGKEERGRILGMAQGRTSAVPDLILKHLIGEK